MTTSEHISEGESSVLRHDPGEARWLWEEAARIYGLHNELAHLYRAKSTDKRTLDRLWELIEEGEYAMRVLGVEL